MTKHGCSDVGGCGRPASTIRLALTPKVEGRLSMDVGVMCVHVTNIISSLRKPPSQGWLITLDWRSSFALLPFDRCDKEHASLPIVVKKLVVLYELPHLARPYLMPNFFFFFCSKIKCWSGFSEEAPRRSLILHHIMRKCSSD